MFFDSFLQSEPAYRSLLSALNAGRVPAAVTGLSAGARAHLITTLSQELSERAVILVSDEGEGTRLCEDLNTLCGEEDAALLYPARDFAFRPGNAVSHQYEHLRLGVLSRVLESRYRFIVCTPDALMQYTLPPALLYARTFTVKNGQTLSPDELCTRLVQGGYAHAELVDGTCQFARRGGIVDFYPADLPLPVRIEFWGDQIDGMATFDPQSQRRVDALKSIRVPPAGEVLFEDPELLADHIEKVVHACRARGSEEVKTRLLSEAQSFRAGQPVTAPDRFLPLLSDPPATLLDYTEDARLYLCETARVKEKARVFHWQLSEDIKTLLEESVLCPGLDTFAMTWSELCGVFESRGAVYMDSFARGSFDTPVKELAALNVRSSSTFQGTSAVLAEDLAPLVRDGYACVVFGGGEKGAMLLADALRTEHGLPADYFPSPSAAPRGKVTVIPGCLSGGFEYPSVKFALISTGRPASSKREKKKKNPNAFHSLEELHPGDYVVHATHGIGIFQGVEEVNMQGISKDYIRIAYAGSDTLYVPVTQLDLVSKYIGPSGDDVKIKLHKLGGTEWAKTRRRVKTAVRDMAKDLIRLYSERMHTKGYAFSPDTDLQNDFERRFEYEETDDQLRCVDEIKYDMERSVPMDRLLCGDVGFGKTEVALRAAFKCIAEGKQCALLVPTTILAWQHYQTILKRMEGLPVSVDLLSRFRSPKEQAETIKKLRRGEVDIVVGTHRLISSDIHFRDLGLLIIDEEQRFGVAQKEKLKSLFAAVDVLTLSATPIPRTLNMAMSGLRDMSIIEEAPQDRHPVQTYVMEYDTGVVCDAIRRELRRGGQVYFIHNHIDTIERIASSLSQRIPEARFAVAHGRMDEESLSEIWRQLIEGEVDVLVCTTIIETGVDVPNVNTLIIENADHMGLSQLHQLRGRVGRSSRRAYAYLTFRAGKALSDVATRRLDAVREFTEFGSGLKIAMRDLEIRGAGNLLGAEQHGQMEAVGYDMYLKLLADAVAEEKGEAVQNDAECTIDLAITAHIPEGYIPDLPQRLAIYRRIADIRSEDDAFDVTDELIDRYGEPPKSVNGLIRIALLRNRAAALGFYEASEKNGSLLLYHNTPDLAAVTALGNRLHGRVLLNAGSRPYLSVKLQKGQETAVLLEELLTFFEQQKTNASK